VAVTGPITFRVLIQTYRDLAKAQKRFDSLRVWGHNVSMETRDSTHYDILIPFSVPLADTLKVKDSLSDFFGRPVHVLLNH
jgi:predicted nucleotidyltransferase